MFDRILVVLVIQPCKTKTDIACETEVQIEGKIGSKCQGKIISTRSWLKTKNTAT